MASEGAFSLKGDSGSKYSFSKYGIDVELDPIPAVYVVASRHYRWDDGKWIHKTIYVDQTYNVKEIFENHQNADCFKKNGANCIGVLEESNEKTRLAIVADLIRVKVPVCNKDKG